jgi:nicotinic acid phosphoribosyltransferase
MTPLPFMTDSYNVSHFLIRNQKETEAVAYLYNRKQPIILFGLAGIVNELQNKFVDQLDIYEAKQDALANGIEFNYDLWEKLIEKHDGYPFRAVTVNQVPEFDLYPAGTPLAKISSKTAPELVTYFEGAMTKCFFPSMVLTRLYEYKKAGIKNLHNFSYRSCNSEQDAYWVSLAFSMLYDGTDNFHINYLKRAVKDMGDPNRHFLQPYREMIDELRPKTIIAANHAVVQGYKDELDMIDNITTKTGLHIAFPIDTYDPERFIIKYLGYTLRKAFENGTNIYFRIDSGNHIEQAEHILNQIVTFKERNALSNNGMPRFGVIIGDHMDIKQILIILNALEDWKKGRKTDIKLDDYVYFGLGGKLLEGISRDQVGMVTKLGWSNVVGSTMKTTNGKQSLLGKLAIKQKGDQYRVYFDDEFYYGDETIRNYQMMKTGFSNVLSPKTLFVTQEVIDAQDKFMEKMLK